MVSATFLDNQTRYYKKLSPQIESSEGLHDPEVSRQAILVQVVVGQVEDFQNRKRAEASRQRRQAVHGQVQNPGKKKFQNQPFGLFSLIVDNLAVLNMILRPYGLIADNQMFFK